MEADSFGGLYSDFLAVVHPEDRELLQAAHREAISGAGGLDIEHRVVRPDGFCRWVHERGELEWDSEGRPVQLTGTILNMTSHKTASAALERNDEDLRALAAQLQTERARVVEAQTLARMGSWETNPATMEVVWSEEVYRIAGKNPQEFQPTHQRFLELVHPGDREMVDQAFRQSLGHTSACTVEHRLLLPDGRLKFVEERRQSFFDSRGVTIRVFGTCRDITKRKQALERIAEQAALIDEAPDAICVHTLDHLITFWSKGAERLFGWTAEAAQGKSVMEVLPVSAEEFAEADRTIRATGTWHGELRVRRRDGTVVILDSRWTLLRNTRGEARSILTIDTDITERGNLEQQFLRSQRMESIGTLAGGIAHDLNNALAPIIMSLDLLKMRFPDKESLDLLEIVSSSAQRGADMVRQVLSFARGVEGRQEEVRIAGLVEEVAKIANETFLKNIRIVSHLPAGLWTVIGDPTQLHQVLLNLCVNARDAMPDGGTLTLSAENIRIDGQYAGLYDGASPGSHVLLQVEDTGTGMSAGVVEKIFDPFFTTKRMGKGTGLGLSTSIAIVKSHGGFLRVDSTTGAGTRFKIYLPAQEAATGEMPPADGKEPLRGHGELILAVDDERRVREITQQTLEVFGYRVVLANDGADAVAVYASRPTEIAAVLTDMMMPVMDGPTAIMVLRRLCPFLPIIAASGLALHEHVAKAAALGVEHFLPKPYTAHALLEMLEELIGAGAGKG